MFSNLAANIQLVLAGPDNYFSDKIEKNLKERNIKNISFYHPHSIEDLVYLYKHAEALINPSLSEGFGLPLIEARYFKTPVIASNLPVFKELLGDGYSSFDPHDNSSIKKAVEQFIATKPTYEYKQLEEFSFEYMVRKYISLISSVTS